MESTGAGSIPHEDRAAAGRSIRGGAHDWCLGCGAGGCAAPEQLVRRRPAPRRCGRVRGGLVGLPPTARTLISPGRCTTSGLCPMSGLVRRRFRRGDRVGADGWRRRRPIRSRATTPEAAPVAKDSLLVGAAYTGDRNHSVAWLVGSREPLTSPSRGTAGPRNRRARLRGRLERPEVN